MIFTEQQEGILKNLIKEEKVEEASQLAKEMLVVKHFHLDIQDFEDDYDYQYCMQYDSDWLKVVKSYLKSSIEVFPLDENGEPDGFCDFDTAGFLGKDNKLYDMWFCEIPLKEFKNEYGITKKELLSLNDTDKWFAKTKNNEAIELAEDLEIYFAKDCFNIY